MTVAERIRTQTDMTVRERLQKQLGGRDDRIAQLMGELKRTYAEHARQRAIEFRLLAEFILARHQTEELPPDVLELIARIQESLIAENATQAEQDAADAKRKNSDP